MHCLLGRTLTPGLHCEAHSGGVCKLPLARADKDVAFPSLIYLGVGKECISFPESTR